MLFVVLSTLFLIVNGNEFDAFKTQHRGKVDLSSMKTCYVYDGTIKNVDSDNEEKGYKCEVSVSVWTEDEKQAKDYCESKFPYYIIGAKSGETTSCTFQMNVLCLEDYWQIHGRCYKVSDSKLTWTEAVDYCQMDQKALKQKMAVYYSDRLSMFLEDMIGINDAWVHVPNLKDYFSNGEDNAGVYVQDSAFKYDVRSGSIIMDDLNSKHQVICEYTAPMEMAEMFYIANIYSEIYPIRVYMDGAVIPSSNFMTVNQNGLVSIKDQSNYKGRAEKFDTDNFSEVCGSIGSILNVESFPMTAVAEEFEDVKDIINDQRYYLTNAFKNDGCSETNYKQQNQDGKDFQIFKPNELGKYKNGYCHTHSLIIHKSGRYPTKAATRAPILCTLHTFNWKFGDCPAGPSWVDEVVRVQRPDRVFCHYIANSMIVTHPQAVEICTEKSFGAALSGIDSVEEFEQVTSKAVPNYPPGTSKHDDGRSSLRGGYTKHIGDHYWLGGVSPCEVDCNNNGKQYGNSWNSNVATNTTFLNTPPYGSSYEHKGGVISFRKDMTAFHNHHIDEYEYTFFICGKSANLVRAERKKSGLKSTR
ncbi:hypothetical protein CAEBREN_23130 [Caenorhabditis brenneri]|uniref:C-type lectin domain-containing protein n=1 Tax=Caenorhabditis brenneri TaxID=135651 RepID=G0NUV1_CAEBE|nr:hypothetical protein CAEBREN_23130 [Caenorhabditis brenneri]